MNTSIKQSNSLNAVLSRFYRLRGQVLSKRFSEFGITLGQFAILRAIYDNSGCIQRELCERTDTSPTVMVGILKTLERLGYIRRELVPENRRIINVYTTDLGQRVVEKGAQMIAETECEYMVGLSQEEFKQFYDLTVRALKSWQDVADHKN